MLNKKMRIFFGLFNYKIKRTIINFMIVIDDKIKNFFISRDTKHRLKKIVECTKLLEYILQHRLCFEIECNNLRY